MKRVTCFVVLAVLVLVTFVARVEAATFQGLGDLAGSTIYSEAWDVSADGLVVVGGSHSGNSGSGYFEAFRWTSGTGMAGLGDLSGGLFASAATGASADGAVVAGQSLSTYSEPFRWTSAGMVGLGYPSGKTEGWVSGISNDGSVLVGNAASPYEAFYWTSSGFQLMGDLGASVVASRASGTSSDGSVIVGHGTSASGKEAFRWTSAGGMVGLGDLTGGSFSSEANGVSPDGSVVVGHGTSNSGIEAFRWTSAGMVGLGDLAGGSHQSFAFDLSADGSLVVGQGNSASGPEAFIWHQAYGMGNLKDVLEDDFGFNLTGWTLTSATGISDDGQVIVGYGNNPCGNTEAWMAIIPIPEPSTLIIWSLLGSLGITVGWWRRRRKAA